MLWSRIAVVSICVVVGVCVAPSAGAQPPPPAETEGGALRAFRYGVDGLALGAYLGLSTGYLVARSDGWTRSDWRTLGLGAGIGALAGAGVGVTLGFVDSARTQRPIGRVVIANVWGGTSFGTLLGAVAGMVSWLSKDDPEHILFGAAIGTLVGAGAGLGFAIIEANRRSDRAISQASPIRVTVGAASQVGGSLCLLPSLVGRY